MGSKKKTKTYKTTTVNTTVIKLSYLQTLALSQGLLQTDSLETDANKSNLGGSTKNTVKLAPFLGITKGKTSSSSTLESSGLKIKDQWLQPYFDRIRYTIGIRELVVAKYTFSERSELISTPFLSPKEIIKAYVMVDEYIPPSFDTHTNWIKYYVKSEGTSDWIEVAPFNATTRFNDQGEILPKIINFNIPKPAIVATENKYNYTSEPVKLMRFRAVFSRPTGGDFDSITPLLKSYRMIMVPRS